MKIVSCTNFMFEAKESDIKGEGKPDMIDRIAIKSGKLAESGINNFVEFARFIQNTKRKNITKAIIIFLLIGSGAYGAYKLGSKITNKFDQSIVEEAKKEIHTVQKGETLNKIAKQHNTTVPTLLSLNPHITDKSKIEVGQMIVLPEK